MYRLFLVVAISATCMWSGVAIAGGSHGDTEGSWIYVVKDKINVYARPSTKASIKGNYRKGNSFYVSNMRSHSVDRGKQKWIYVKSVSRRRTGWIRREDVALPVEFHKVKKWPFRYLAFEFGDEVVVYWFDKAGVVLPSESAHSSSGDKREEHLFEKDGVVLIGWSSGLPSGQTMAVVDQRNRLCPGDLAGTCDEFFSMPQTWYFGRFSEKPHPVYDSGTCILDCQSDKSKKGKK